MAVPLAASDPPDRPAWVDAVDNPYLHGVFTPTDRETAAADCEVLGELPAGLDGVYVRNGPNPVFAPPNPYHWFDGDGMLHAVRFRNGRASYRSRWVATRGLAREREAGRAIWPGLMGPYDFDLPGGFLKDTANTDVLWFNRRLLALWYVAGAAYCVDPLTLEPRGVETFAGAWTGTMSAHPKVDERTGELLWFTYGDEPPYMTYGVAAADGTLTHRVPVDLPGPRLPHDLTFTTKHTILHDFPLFHDPEELRRTRRRIVRFHRDVPTRFGVVPRHGETVRWFEFAPGYVLHMVNAWEEGDWIVMDGCFQPDPTIRRRPEEGPLASMLAYFRVRSFLYRWRMNLRTGETREGPLDDLNVEFCLPDVARYGTRTRWSYHQHIPCDQPTLGFSGLVKYDHEDGSAERFEYGAGLCGSEAPFAPRPGATGEDDGWVVTIVVDACTYASECWVFDAREVRRGPIARVKLPARVPTGFHATWVPGAKLGS